MSINICISALIVLIIAPYNSNGFTAVDFSALMLTDFNETTFSCLQKDTNADTFIFPMLGRSCLFFACDDYSSHVTHNIKVARTVAVQSVTGIISASTRCAQPENLVRNLLNQIEKSNQYLDQIWIDMYDNEYSKLCYWSDKPSDNKAYLTRLIQTVQSANISIGIYTDQPSWNRVMGNSEEFSIFDLWYRQIDQVASFDNFKPFGGWTRPAMKRYTEQYKACGQTGLNMNFWALAPPTTTGVTTTQHTSPTTHKKGAGRVVYQSSILMFTVCMLVHWF